ncbi:Beta-lactamase hydrolase-like protein [Luteitalea pratensis]|jgi:uncharacterized protein (TIGR01244 family)|uniref:Beta-lactamase hydrolase-like protein n=1 Tax=Luteitalea pratensis TaxID=1855912 RepID=A0A143PVK9_LUTPR|nr:sulfur transferase domain-containing protein [Luteitalea pratensis]AMY12787.1 Beta-lactamase hydrolase-like protein [Luteitalea pratensis]
MVAGVVNYTQVNASVACGGDTPRDVFPSLAEQGFRAVVNLRLDGEPGVAEEAAAVDAAGLRYVHLPMTPTAPEFETAEQFLDVVADPSNQPVYIHCASANRVGGVWAIKRVVQDGWSREAALAEGHAIGLKSPVMIDFVHRFLDARG